MRPGVYKNSLYKKMFLYISILVVVIILSLSFILYFNFENVGLKMQFDANKNILSEISYSAKYLDDTARNISAYIYSNNDYSQLRYGVDPDMGDAYKLMSGLEALVTQSGNVHSVYIYNGGLDRFYSTWWRFYSPSDSFLDNDIVDLIHNNKIPDRKIFTSTPIIRKIPLYINYGPDTNYINVLTYIMSDYSEDKKIQSAIIINLNSQYLDGLIDILNTKGSLNGGTTFILNGDGQTVAGCNISNSLSYLKKENYIKRIIKNNSRDGQFIDTIDGKKFVITYVSSDVTDWKFVNVTPYNEIFKDINKMKNKIYIFCLSILALGFLLTYLISKRLYSPINNMVGKVQKLSNSKLERNVTNELDFLTGVFTDALEKARSIQSVNHENNLIKRNEFFKELLVKEDIIEETVKEKFIEYNIDMCTSGKFVLCNLCIDHYSSFSQELNIEDQKLFRFAICNVASEIALRLFKNHCFEVDDRNIMLILEIENPDDNQIKTELFEIIEEIQEWCQANLKISLSASISITPVVLTDIPESFKLTSELSKYRFVYGNRSILLPGLLAVMESNVLEHPVVLEQKLDDALNNGKLNDAIEAYNKIIEYICGYSFDTINSYILYLSYIIIKKFNDLEAKGYEKVLFDSNGFISDIISLETLSETNERVINVFRIITDTIEQKRFKRKSALVEKVKNIIEAEYMDSSLCLDIVAGRLNISRDYLGKMFREAYCESFADYLTGIRLQKAVELLENSKKSVSEIMNEIGWENKNYFYTTFKQRYGMTTSEYRNKNAE